MRRTLLTTAVFTATLLVLGTIMHTNVWAFECNYYSKTLTDYNKEFSILNMIKTGIFDKLINTLISTPIMLITGKEMGNFEKCAAQVLKDNVTLDDSCTLDDPEMCSDLGIVDPDSGLKADNINGSLLSLATRLEQGINSKDPIPVNLAYYTNRQLEKVPFVGTVYAADTRYGGPFLEYIYSIWSITRNVAFGLMAVVMLVVGILIITRKKVSAQTSVTVQQALPQVVIAVILITFSYPIGAAGASIAFNIKGSVWNMLTAAISLAELPPINVPNSVFVMFMAMLSPLNPGVVTLVMSVISIVIALVMIILVMIKSISIYLKMIFAIVTSPLTFAVGAIPGYQDTTVNWFKQYAAWVVGLPAMHFMLFVTLGLVISLGMNVVTNGYSVMGGWGWGMLAGFAIPVITIFGCNLARSIPEKLEEVLGVGAGAKKKK